MWYPRPKRGLHVYIRQRSIWHTCDWTISMSRLVNSQKKTKNPKITPHRFPARPSTRLPYPTPVYGPPPPCFVVSHVPIHLKSLRRHLISEIPVHIHNRETPSNYLTRSIPVSVRLARWPYILYHIVSSLHGKKGPTNQ